MSDFKEFQGKSLDEAIQAACKHFDLKRDKLEVEILSGGSTGIFGLVGAKKATIKARPRGQVKPLSESRDGSRAKPAPKDKPADKPEKGSDDDGTPPKQEKKPRGRSRSRGRSNAPTGEPRAQGTETTETGPEPGNRSEPEAKPSGRGRSRDQKTRPERKARPERKRPERKPRAEAAAKPEKPAVPLDPVKLESAVNEVSRELLGYLVDEPEIEISIDGDKVNVFIEDGEDSGLIIGREGATLSSLQYLVNRIVARRMEQSVRVQIDSGDYRERQDDKLRQMAWHLADKVRETGRTQSTKPLSSYHRRVIHLALQEEEEVFTRSKGEGPLKRVLIVAKRRGRNGNR